MDNESKVGSAVCELPAAIAGFLDAVNRSDAAATGQFLTQDVTYHLIVPYPPVTGRDAVVAALSRSINEANRVRWDVVNWAAASDTVFVERIDRFWFGEREAAIECNGVFVLCDGLIREVRDYADMNTWLSRKAAATGQK